MTKSYLPNMDKKTFLTTYKNIFFVSIEKVSSFHD